MSLIKSEYKVAQYKNGLFHFGEVSLTLQLTKNGSLEIVENHSGGRFFSQGYEQIVTEKGYSFWKKGIELGIIYAYSKLKNSNGLRVTIDRACGLATDTNSIILGFAASRAVLNKLDHLETESKLKKLKELVYSSWDYEFESLPDFNNISIEGNKLAKSKYEPTDKITSELNHQQNKNLWFKVKTFIFGRKRS